MFHVRGADQAEVPFVRDHKNHTSIVILEQICLIFIIQFGHNNVTTPNQPQSGWIVAAQNLTIHHISPGPSSVHNSPCHHLARLS